MSVIATDKNVYILNDLTLLKTKKPTGKIIGQTNSFLLNNCIIEKDNCFICNGVRLEKRKHVLGVKVGYLEVGYEEYILVKSTERLITIILSVLLFILFLMLLI